MEKNHYRSRAKFQSFENPILVTLIWTQELLALDIQHPQDLSN